MSNLSMRGRVLLGTFIIGFVGYAFYSGYNHQRADREEVLAVRKIVAPYTSLLGVKTMEKLYQPNLEKACVAAEQVLVTADLPVAEFDSKMSELEVYCSTLARR